MQEVVWLAPARRREFTLLLDNMLNGWQEQPVAIRRDDWGKRVLNLLENIEPDLHENWIVFLKHCATASGSKPGGTWLEQTSSLITALGQEHFVRLTLEWINAFGRHRGDRLEKESASLLVGLAWSGVQIADSTLAFSLAEAAIEGYRKISGVGPRSPKVADACVYTLQHMPDLRGVAQLERVRLNVKQPSYLKFIERALDEAAQQAGMSRLDLEELTVPTFGFEGGKRRVPFGSASAEIEIVGSTLKLQWYDPSGKPRKAEPAEVKRDHKPELKDLKLLTQDIARMLNAQRERLERLPLSERSWSLGVWRARYLDHPLVGHIVRRLIWRFTDGDRITDAIWCDGQLVDVNDQPLALTETAVVSSWHPIFCDAGPILAWRIWLERHEVTQPFKQAHREIYLLTDAERQTRFYSNRFAAHILRQHQFHTLVTGRGWKNQLRLMVDDSYPPATLELPHWGLRAEFWIEGAGDTYGVDTNDVGTYLHLATDQVRFYRLGAARNAASASGGGYSSWRDWREIEENDVDAPLPLDQVPPLVFSETFRDVDLFVGVASIGNDPTWQDGSHTHTPHYQNYWQSYNLSELSAVAETRKQLLERLIPKLAIADRCTIDGRYLIVRGDLATYKIHLGSGNILMAANGQYLCIVPQQFQTEDTPGNLFLPFEGDRVFSIILSKAFLLAEDTKITDPSITRQIDRAR